MRVLKHKDQSFLAGVFAMSGKIFFAAAGLLFFDLEHPEIPLPEKDLWQLVKKRVPGNTPFDSAMPKSQGEVLVYGACHPRQGENASRQAQEVVLSLGELRKKLYVFGKRHWEETAAGWQIVHDTPLATPLPLTWEHAFGAPGFPRNPLGLGASPLHDGQGGEFHPLPQIEAPDRLIGDIQDQPEPATLSPIPQTWPQRLEKAGTYDDKWLREHWPHLPPDFDMRFFNTAPMDQQVKDYFHGDEALTLENMHPLHRTLSSRLPGLRLRIFATLLNDPGDDPKDLSKASFQELQTHLDTVWLFPEEMRGALCYRGVCEIKDEEYRDVAGVMLVTEPLNAPDQPLEHYRDLRDTWVDRMLQLDKTPLEDGKQRIAEAMNRLLSLPDEIRGRLDKSLGKTPHAPTTTTEKFSSAGSRLDASAALLDKLENTALSLRAKHGHIARIDLSHLGRMRQTIAGMREKMARTEQGLAQVQSEADQVRQEARQKLVERKKALADRGIEADIDPDDVLLPPRELRWKRAVLQQLGPWRKELLRNAALYNNLLDLGLSEKTIENALLGYNPEPLTAERKVWGLEPQGEETTFTIPAGLVLPQFQAADPVALRIRQSETPFPPLEEDHLVPGSLPPDKAPMLLAPAQGRILARVSDQLEGLFLVQLAGDLCTAAVLKTPDATLGEEGEKLLSQAPAFAVCVQGKSAEEAEKIWHLWHTAVPQAQRLPLQHDGVFAAAKQGRDIRALLRRLVPADKPDALPEDPAPPVTAADVKPGMALPLMDIRKFASETRARARADIEARIAPSRQQAEAMRAEAMDKAAQQLRKQGLSAEEYLRPRTTDEPLDFAAVKNELRQTMEQTRTRLAAQNQLTPEIEEKLDSSLSSSSAMLDKAAAVLPASGGIAPPQWAKDLRARHGMDPETGQGLTREQVMGQLQNGHKDFSGKNLSGLDLSGLNFSGAILSDAVCIATNFSDCNLREANLHKAFCKQALFGKTVLVDADLERCVLHKALLAEADLTGCRCRRTLFSEADCTKTSFHNADLNRAVLLKTRLSGAQLPGVRAERAVFNQAQFENNDLSGADFSRSVFIQCTLEGLSFSGLTLQKTVFMGCKGHNVDFSAAKLQNARFLKQCSLPKAVFARADLRKASFMNCSLVQANLQEADLQTCLLQDCDLSGASLWHALARGARFPHCNLEGANLRGIDLLHGSLRKARLVAADCSGANLFGVDLYKAVLGDTSLDLADFRRTLLEHRDHLLPGARRS